MAGRVRWRQEILLEQIYSVCVPNLETGCLEWTRATDGGGYGKFHFQGKLWSAPRAVLYVTTGKLGPVARHSCDNPPCCFQEHLQWGTQKDNAADARARGRLVTGDQMWMRRFPERVRRGESCTWARLTAEQVTEIRARINAGERACDLAEEFGLHPEHVGKIKRRLAWKHVP